MLETTVILLKTWKGESLTVHHLHSGGKMRKKKDDVCVCLFDIYMITLSHYIYWVMFCGL